MCPQAHVEKCVGPAAPNHAGSKAELKDLYLADSANGSNMYYSKDKMVSEKKKKTVPLSVLSRFLYADFFFFPLCLSHSHTYVHARTRTQKHGYQDVCKQVIAEAEDKGDDPTFHILDLSKKITINASIRHHEACGDAVKQKVSTLARTGVALVLLKPWVPSRERVANFYYFCT